MVTMADRGRRKSAWLNMFRQYGLVFVLLLFRSLSALVWGNYITLSILVFSLLLAIPYALVYAVFIYLAGVWSQLFYSEAMLDAQKRRFLGRVTSLIITILSAFTLLFFVLLNTSDEDDAAILALAFSVIIGVALMITAVAFAVYGQNLAKQIKAMQNIKSNNSGAKKQPQACLSYGLVSALLSANFFSLGLLTVLTAAVDTGDTGLTRLHFAYLTIELVNILLIVGLYHPGIQNMLQEMRNMQEKQKALESPLEQQGLSIGEPSRNIRKSIQIEFESANPDEEVDFHQLGTSRSGINLPTPSFGPSSSLPQDYMGEEGTDTFTLSREGELEAEEL